MLQLKRLNKKGQEEFVAIISILVFVGVTLIVFAFLGYFSSGTKQEIIGKFEDTEMQETLSVYLMTPKDSESNVADLIINSIKNKDFKELEDFSLKIMEPGFLWIILVESGNNEWIYTITPLEGYKNKDREGIGEILESRGLLSFRSVQAYIPNPYGEIKNVKVSLIEIPERGFGEVPAMGV